MPRWRRKSELALDAAGDIQPRPMTHARGAARPDFCHSSNHAQHFLVRMQRVILAGQAIQQLGIFKHRLQESQLVVLHRGVVCLGKLLARQQSTQNSSRQLLAAPRCAEPFYLSPGPVLPK